MLSPIKRGLPFMKTVSVLAKELNVSVQTIYRVLNKVKQSLDPSEREGLTEIKQGVIHLSEYAINEINKALPGVKHSVEQGNKNEEEVIYLKSLIEQLQQELIKERELSRNQAYKIIQLAEKMSEITRQTHEQLIPALRQDREHIEKLKKAENQNEQLFRKYQELNEKYIALIEASGERSWKNRIKNK